MERNKELVKLDVQLLEAFDEDGMMVIRGGNGGGQPGEKPPIIFNAIQCHCDVNKKQCKCPIK